MIQRQTFIPALSYQDPVAALKWLERAFGFDTSMFIMGRSGVYRAEEFQEKVDWMAARGLLKEKPRYADVVRGK